MGRLTISESQNSGTTSGVTNSSVYIFVDEFGNVTQIKKEDKKTRSKYYIDLALKNDFIEPCVIGVSDEKNGECSLGIGLGIGDNTFAFAKYE